MVDLTFTVRKLLTRDELVFKAIVRILHGQTKHNWLYTPDLNADLIVIGPVVESDDCPDSLLRGRAVMALTAEGPAPQQSSVVMHVGDVLAKLNAVGEQILADPGKLQAKDASQTGVGREEQYGLLRWPEWSLMQQDRAYARIATVLATRPVTLRELAIKSDVGIDDCARFLQLLRERNLIRTVAPVPTTTAAPTTKATDEAVVTRPPKAATLWGRIRSRLGIARESRGA